VRTTWLKWAGLSVAAATVVLAVVLASRFGADPGVVDSPLIGRPAPELDLDTLDGAEAASLSDLRGDIVVVNFFASWCAQCRAEHSAFVAVSEAFADDGVSFIRVGYQESAAESLSYLERAGPRGRIAYLADPGSRAAIAYGVFGVPETFFIDPDGVVVAKIVGEAAAMTLGSTIDSIRRGEAPGQTVTGDTARSPGASSPITR